MTAYAYDAEFLEDGRTIDLISIGIVAADGADWGGPERADVVREWRHAIHQAHQIAGEGNEQ